MFWQPGDSFLVQSGSFFATENFSTNFHRASLHFQYPGYVCIPGRVWKTMKCEWHHDITNLPTSVFTRSEIAKIADLRACFALPLCRQGQFTCVVLFFSRSVIPHDERLEHTLFSLANDIMGEVCARMGHAQLQFVDGGQQVPAKKGQSGASKVCTATQCRHCTLLHPLLHMDSFLPPPS